MKKLKEIIKAKLGKKRIACFRKIINIFRIVKNVVCWTLIAVLTVVMVIFVITKFNGGIPSVFGYSVHRIMSGSMEPELIVGDVIVNKDVSDPSEVHVNDIVTFRGGSNFENQDVTHRVIVAPYTDDSGDTVIVTKGDANKVDDGVIVFDKVQSKYLAKINFLKEIYDFFFSPWGFIIFIFLLLMIFFDEIMNIVRLTVSSSEQKDSESFKEILERVKKEQLDNSMQQLPSGSISQVEDGKQIESLDLNSEEKELNGSTEKTIDAKEEKPQSIDGKKKNDKTDPKLTKKTSKKNVNKKSNQTKKSNNKSKVNPKSKNIAQNNTNHHKKKSKKKKRKKR